MNDARFTGCRANAKAKATTSSTERLRRIRGGALAIVACLGVVACAAPELDEESSSSSESYLEAVDIAVGTELVTTTPLNLRTGPGTSFDILFEMPPGTRVTVASASGSSGWVNITSNGTTGFASVKYLGIAGKQGEYSPSRGAQIANRAVSLWNGRYSRGLCLSGVDDTAESSGIFPGVGWVPRQPSAVAWQNFVNGNPDVLAKRGYVRQDRDMNDLPKGTILGWRAGQCGYHSQYGHIEIVVDDNSSRACSDYCGTIYKTCGKPYIYVPVEL